MKRQIVIAAMAMLAGATVGQAQTITTTVTNGVTIARGPINLNVKVKLNAATKPTAPTVTGLQWAQVQVPISATVTNQEDVFGTSILDSTSLTIGTTNIITSVISTNAWLISVARVDLGKARFAEAAAALTNSIAGTFGSSNAVWFITGTLTTDRKSNTTLSAKAVGIWAAGVSSCSASISTAKKAKK